MPLSDESAHSIESRVSEVDSLLHLKAVSAFVGICRSKRRLEDLLDAVDLLEKASNVAVTLSQDVALLLEDREDLIELLCHQAEQLKIYEDLERIRNEKR